MRDVPKFMALCGSINPVDDTLKFKSDRSSDGTETSSDSSTKDLQSAACTRIDRLDSEFKNLHMRKEQTVDQEIAQVTDDNYTNQPRDFEGKVDRNAGKHFRKIETCQLKSSSAEIRPESKKGKQQI